MRKKEEYLSHFRPDLLSGDVSTMLAENRIQDKSTLTEYLSQAYDNLMTTPGLNQNFRRANTPDWIGWWIKFLSESKKVPGTLLPFEKIKGNLAKDNEYGVLFAGGLEGHIGHRYAVDWMKLFVKPILLLEQDWYVESKKRGGPYLDLRARLSMWAYYGKNIIVSVLPKKSDDIDASEHYRNLFDQTGAAYCFASKSDSFSTEKIARGKYAPFLIIPDVNIRQTTTLVETLAPDEIDLVRLANTTDRVRKLSDTPTRKELKELISSYKK